MTLWDIIRLGRPHFLTGGFLLYSYGALQAVLSGAEASFGGYVLGYLALFFGQLSVSYSNDYFDRAADTKDRTLFSGGSGILQKKPHLSEFAKRLAIALICLSMAAAVASVVFFGFPAEFITLAAAGNILGWCYSAPPLRLSHRGLGELSTAAAFGLIMPGVGYFALKQTVDGFFFASSIPLLFYGFLFILSVEIPDIEADKASGKKTLPTRLGAGFGYTMIAALALAATFYYSLTDQTMALLSVIPTATGLYSMTAKKRETAKYVTASLIVFLLLANIYLSAAAGFYPTYLIYSL